MRKIIIVTSLFFANLVYAETAMELSRRLGLNPGHYVVKSENESCFGGDLLVKKSSDGSFNLVLGARILLVSITKAKFTEVDYECTLNVENQISKGFIVSKRTDTCEGKPTFKRKTTVHFKENSIDYEIEMNAEGEKTTTIRCDLVVGKDDDGDAPFDP